MHDAFPAHGALHSECAGQAVQAVAPSSDQKLSAHAVTNNNTASGCIHSSNDLLAQGCVADLEKRPGAHSSHVVLPALRYEPGTQMQFSAIVQFFVQTELAACVTHEQR